MPEEKQVEWSGLSLDKIEEFFQEQLANHSLSISPQMLRNMLSNLMDWIEVNTQSYLFTIYQYLVERPGLTVSINSDGALMGYHGDYGPRLQNEHVKELLTELEIFWKRLRSNERDRVHSILRKTVLPPEDHKALMAYIERLEQNNGEAE